MKRKTKNNENIERQINEAVNSLIEDLNSTNFHNFSKLANKINNMNLNDDESLDVIYIVASNIIEKNEKNIDTIHELVNIIREAINEIDKKEQKTPEMIKLKKILLKYKENN